MKFYSIRRIKTKGVELLDARQDGDWAITHDPDRGYINRYERIGKDCFTTPEAANEAGYKILMKAAKTAEKQAAKYIKMAYELGDNDGTD